MNNNIDINRAKLVYNDYLKLQKSTVITNPLLDDDEINELLGFTTDSTIYNLQYLLGHDRGEDESFNIILESIDSGVSFDEMLEKLNKICEVR